MKYGIDPTVREVSAEVADVIRELDDAFLLRSLAHSAVYASTSLSRQTDLQTLGVFPTTATHSTPHTFYYLSTPLPSPPPPLYALSRLQAQGRRGQWREDPGQCARSPTHHLPQLAAPVRPRRQRDSVSRVAWSTSSAHVVHVVQQSRWTLESSSPYSNARSHAFIHSLQILQILDWLRLLSVSVS